MSTQENTPVRHLTPRASGSHSVLSTPSNKAERDDIKDFDAAADREAAVDIPKRPASSYIGVSILCLMVAFGGFVFGWDTGTISGFVNLSDFLKRFGQRNSEGEYYLSKVRMGLIVSIFNIGCAIGGLVLSKIGDVYGRRIGWLLSLSFMSLVS